MATDNMHKKLCEVRTYGFRVMQADRQTDTHKQTDILITILCNPNGAK